MTSQLTNTQLEDLLAAVTDALLLEGDDVDAIIDRYQVDRREVNNLIWLIRRLHVALVGVQPSPQFVHRLKHDLVGNSGSVVISGVRRLPPRVQIAAAIALIIGFLFIQRRRDEADATEAAELPALQTHPN